MANKSQKHGAKNNADFIIESGVLKKYIGSSKEVIVPKSVTKIGANAFQNCTHITSVTLPKGLKSIKKKAFKNCTDLVSINFPNGLIKIGELAFSGCTSLASIDLPNTLKKIGFMAFYDCSSLTSIILPDSVIKMKGQAFADCDQLTSITLSAGMTSIPHSAFMCCKALTSITMPEGITKIGLTAFHNCTSLENITLPNSLKKIDAWAFNGSGLTSIAIPKGVTKIRSSSFSHCQRLTLVFLHDKLTSIDSFAFNNCHGLTSIYIPYSVTKVAETAFAYCDQLQYIKSSLPYTTFKRTPFYNKRNDILQKIIDSDDCGIGSKAGTMPFACCTTIDQYDTLVDLGYAAIELAGNKIAAMSEEEFAVVKETIQNGSIPCCGFNSSIPANIAIMGDGFDEAIITDYAKLLCKRGADLGIQNIGIGSPLSRVLLPHHNLEEEWAKATRFVEIFAKEAEPYGITILWESLNHLDSNFGLKLIEGKEMIERLGLSNVGIVFDIYHLFIESEGISEIQEVLPYIRHMHIAERVDDKRTFPTVALFDYYKEILQEVLDGGYTGLLSVESFNGDESVGLPQSKALLDDVLAALY